eukprot:scaffold280012_cov24-Tisochrysis_lutea.AAC.4
MRWGIVVERVVASCESVAPGALPFGALVALYASRVLARAVEFWLSVCCSTQRTPPPAQLRTVVMCGRETSLVLVHALHLLLLYPIISYLYGPLALLSDAVGTRLSAITLLVQMVANLKCSGLRKPRQHALKCWLTTSAQCGPYTV